MQDYLKLSSQALYYRLATKLIPALVLAIMFFIVAYVITLMVHVSLWVLAPFALLIPFTIAYLMAYLEYIGLGYKLEPHALNLREGIIALDTETIPFTKIVNVSLQQSLMQRIFAVGTLIIDQEDTSSTWENFDIDTAHKIIEEIAAKSNIQPITQ